MKDCHSQAVLQYICKTAVSSTVCEEHTGHRERSRSLIASGILREGERQLRQRWSRFQGKVCLSRESCRELIKRVHIGAWTLTSTKNWASNEPGVESNGVP